MEQSDALKAYTDIMRELARFEAEHAGFVEAYKKFMNAAMSAEDVLKAATREAGMDIENRYYEVRLVPKERRWYDPDMLLAAYPEAGNMAGVVNVSIDRDIVDRLVRHGNIPAEAAEKALCADQITPAVYIRNKQNLIGEKAIRKARKATKVVMKS